MKVEDCIYVEQTPKRKGSRQLILDYFLANKRRFTKYISTKTRPYIFAGSGKTRHHRRSAIFTGLVGAEIRKEALMPLDY